MRKVQGGFNMNTDKIYAESIVNEYSHKETSKVVALKKLDKKAKQPSFIFALTFGIASSLVLGTGMCLAMGVLGGGTKAFIAGIAVGIVGIIGCAINYPIFKKMRKSGKEKYAGDIMALAKEISERDE